MAGFTVDVTLRVRTWRFRVAFAVLAFASWLLAWAERGITIEVEGERRKPL